MDTHGYGSTPNGYPAPGDIAFHRNSDLTAIPDTPAAMTRTIGTVNELNQRLSHIQRRIGQWLDETVGPESLADDRQRAAQQPSVPAPDIPYRAVRIDAQLQTAHCYASGLEALLTRLERL